MVRPDDPKLLGHPMLKVEGWRRIFVPLLVHGDGVRCSSRGNNLLVVSLGFLLSRNWSWMSVFMLALFTKHNRCYSIIHAEDTWHTIWLYLCHGFKALLEGVHPLLDPHKKPWTTQRQRELAGQKICGGKLRACIWGLPCDGEYAANELGCANASSLQMCTWCPANKSNYNYKNFHPAAPYKPLCYQAGPTDRPVSRHPIWDGLGVTRFTYTGDVMHGGELGPLLHLYGSTLVDMMGNGLEVGCVVGGTMVRRLNEVWILLYNEYPFHNVSKPISGLTFGMLGDIHNFPQLGVHAAESRQLLHPMLSLVRKHMNRTALDKHRIAAYEHIAAFYDVIMSAGLVLTDDEADTAAESIDKFLLHYNVLSKKAHADSLRLYGITPKFHWMWHISRFSRFLNPRVVWCYQYEDFIGRIQRAAASCQVATPMWKVPGKCMTNYIYIYIYSYIYIVWLHCWRLSQTMTGSAPQCGLG